MIRIVNLRNYTLKPGEILIKVDRTSPVGNPFHMKNESQRDEVCDKYEQHFQSQMGTNFFFVLYIDSIVHSAKTSDVALGCWCYPKRCHAETLQAYVEEELKGESVNDK